MKCWQNVKTSLLAKSKMFGKPNVLKVHKFDQP